MKKYLIIRCARCGLAQYVLSNQKTRKCPGCNYHIQLHSSLIEKQTDDLTVAQELVKYFKLPESQRNKMWEEMRERKRGRNFL